MRLLAYGGTAYVERQRIGSWENAPRDALDDSFRLEQERLTFGLCLIGNDPVLVIRQLQITRTGRGYAYSLLFDPGMDIWHKFDWDAAALAHALFNERSDIRTLLLEQPEKLNVRELQAILDSVSEKTDQSIKKPPSEVNDHEAAWIGGFFTPSPSSLPPQVLGFPMRPDFAETSALIHRLPVCFRAGMGWLVGSSSESARSFGGRLSIDERADLDSSTPFVEQGRQLYKALQALADNDEFAETAHQLATKPAWDWFAGATKNPDILADRLVLVADLFESKSEQDELLDKAIVTLPETEFLQNELRQAWQRAVISNKKKLTEKQTLFALENYFDHALQLPADYLAFLDPQKLAERFVSEGLQPSHQNVPQLPLPLRRTVWGLHLQQSQNEDLPRIFFEAINDLEEMGGDEAVDHMTALTKEVGERMAKDRSVNLLYWKNHTEYHHRADIRELLCNVSMQRARSGNSGWEFEYLLFAEDDGGEKLSRENITKTQLRNMILSFVKVVQDRREYAAEATHWLTALADSSIRASGVLTCEDKLLISTTVRTHKWIKYVDLWDLYVNHTAIPNPPRVTGEDKTILLKELEELIRQKPARDFAPDVRGLQIMLGTLPGSTMRFFQELSPKFSDSENAKKWVQYWESTDPARASKEEVRVLLEVENDISNNFWLKPEFEEKQLNALLLALMFCTHPNRNELYHRRFHYVLTQALAYEAKRVLSAIRSIFKDGINTPAQAKVFCERFSKDRDSLGMLFQVLPKSSSGLDLTDALYKARAGYFVKEAQNAWLAAQERPSTPYEKALLYHLSKRKGTRIQVERELEDQFPGERIKLRLDEILKQDSTPGVTANQPEEDDSSITRRPETTKSSDDDVAGDEEERKSFGQTLKEFFGFGSAQKESKDSDGRRGEIFGGLSSANRTSGRRNNTSKDGD